MARRRYATPPALVVKDGSEASAPRGGANAQPERQLLERCRRGERQAYGQVVELYQGRVFGLVRRLVGSETVAEDITQEAFVRAYLSIGRFDSERPFLPWIFRIAVNLTRNWFKAAARREIPCGPESNLLQPNRARPLDERLAIAQRLERALLELDPKYRVPLVLKHVEGLDYRQMKEVLGVPVTALKMRVSRARAMLRKLLGDEFGTGVGAG